ncbi:P-loop containing nucleoside triphosphate hydrolase protein [Pseudomassariella vexata]|uniref:p-loop containing nucleoside triphosphate hydrolase protein n=1 Tax=Pseudomassariella vexata TaxID=1141098 RepID=A0A1Y2DV90_9PEZI|nr:P-loop containing nucleoside triphosphate hydrolase protein [Pseudomassariella vexata]ORY63191.1 P-loop containing nucleoside triphosphate hydrolase protein [Pseudomassariella vexata]
MESGLSVGKVCIVEAANGTGTRREAIAWPSTDRNVAKNVMMLSRALQEATGIKLEDRVQVTPGGDVPVAEKVTVRDVSEGLEPLEDIERPHWEFFLKGRFEISEHIFPGLAFRDLSVSGPKRSFVVISVNGRNANVAKYSRSTLVELRDEDAAAEANMAPGKLEVHNVPGMQPQLDELNYFFSYFDVDFGRNVPRCSCGIVIEGSRGTGKSMLLKRIGASRWGDVVRIKSTDKATKIQECFTTALNQQRPTIILIDDFKRVTAHNQGAVDAIADGLDDLAEHAAIRNRRPNVVVVATCLDFLEDIPQYLQTEDRFDEYITLPIPTTTDRKEIIRSMKPNFSPEYFEQYISDVADRTHAYTGRDLKRLVIGAGKAADKRTKFVPTNEPLVWEDIKTALASVRPTAMHDIRLKPPTVRWNDIAGYSDVKDTLLKVFKQPKAGEDVLWKPPKGALMYGPPGCSKTMIAQAMATESGFNFFAVKGGELLNMYVGETERAIRKLFQRARDASPSIIFFDEIDSIVGSRSGSGGSATSGGIQAVGTLLTEMDGFEELGKVFVLAATNKPDSLDPALLRPGRFDELIYVPLPEEKTRETIWANKAIELKFEGSVDIPELARMTEGYSGAEIARICDRAFRDYRSDGGLDAMGTLVTAVASFPPRVSKDTVRQFEAWRVK